MTKVIFLHHSTGKKVWLGKTNKYINILTQRNDVQYYFKQYNRKNRTNYSITECTFPKAIPYGWKNYPYDYYNIWVKNAGDKPFKEEPTLEILAKKFDVIIFKHCYPVSHILADTGKPDINSAEKRVENYKMQYNALKNKMHEFPDTKFIVWTPAVCIKTQITQDEASLTHNFYRWIIDEWDETGDNIFVWDYYKYQTEGGIYLLDEYSEGLNNSHPNKKFSARVSPLFCKYIIDVIESVAK